MFTYTLVGGAGSADNAAFTITGNTLQAATNFNFEAKSSYTARVRATDAGGRFTEKQFTIGVTNIVEPLRAEFVRMPEGKAYKAGDSLRFTVILSRPVTLAGGAPDIAVLAGPGQKSAVYAGGSGTNKLAFQYVVKPGDNATTVSIGGAIRLPAGVTIRDASKTNLPLGIPGGAVPGASLDTAAPTAPVTILGPGVGLVPAGGATADEATQASGVVKVTGEKLAAIAVTFTGTKVAPVVKNLVGTGTAQGVVLTAGDLTALGQGKVTVSAVQTDRAGNRSPAGTTVFTLDTGAPTISGVPAPVSKTYRVGDVVRFTVIFSENVVVTGKPFLSLTLANNVQRRAEYVSGSGSKTLVFEYRVRAGDSAPKGPTLAAATELNGGTINDSAGNNAGLTFRVPVLSGVVISGGIAKSAVFALL